MEDLKNWPKSWPWGLANRGHEVIVYNPSDHPIKGWKHHGVKLVRRFNPEVIMGSGRAIYL